MRFLKKHFSAVLCLFSLITFFIIKNVMTKKVVLGEPFSYKEVAQISDIQLQDPLFLEASDGVSLAYYPFLPKGPSALVILYHGGGVYSNAYYQHIGTTLKNEYKIGCYCVDIRGHGNSGGPRGDAPSINQVLEDISTVLALVKKDFPDTAVYLVGHSSGAGLLLNYSGYQDKKSDLYDGYVFLAPYFGPRVGVERPGAPVFVKEVKLWIFLVNQLLRLPIYQHVPAVFFNYPPAVFEKDPRIVTTYSYLMSCATTPNNPAILFEQLDKPCTLFIGSDDEQFDPEKIVAFADYNKNDRVSTVILPGLKHLSILLDAPTLIADSIVKKVLNRSDAI